jgi:hypothetical protein
MANQFDEASKALARGQSRRQALGRLAQGALALAGVIGFFSLGGKSRAGSQKQCERICGPGNPTCVDACLNCNGTYCLSIGLGPAVCCPHGTKCGHTPLGSPVCV